MTKADRAFKKVLEQVIATRWARESVRCPSLKRMAEFIERVLGYSTKIEPSHCNTDRKIGRLRSEGRGRDGNKLSIFNGSELIHSHDSAETYRRNYEVAAWILKQI